MYVEGPGSSKTYPTTSIWRGQTLKYGSRGTYVKQLQEMLNQAGYNAGKADGIFGKNTKNAVMSFQRDNRLAQDGIAGKNTYNALIKNLQNKAKKQVQNNAANNHWTGQTLRIGSRGQAVKDLQNNLKKLGYNVGAVDGIYGKQTASAVKSFQKKYGLSQDGIAGKNTYSALNQALQGRNTYNKTTVIENRYKALEKKVNSKNSTWGEVSKSLKDLVKMGFDFIIGDSIKTLKDPNATTVDKLLSALDFIPQGKVINGGIKIIKKVGGKIHLKFTDQFVKEYLNPRTRLPRSNGKWVGEPGNGKWYSDNTDVISVTGGKPVEFKNGRPDFKPWAKGKLTFNKGELTGTNKDFNLVYDELMRLKGFKSRNQAKNWLKEKGLTPHHDTNTTIILVPTKLHKNIPHIGSASDLRGGY